MIPDSPFDRALDQALADLADGKTPDWAALEALADTPERKGLVEEVRLVADIAAPDAAVTRSPPSGPFKPTRGHAADPLRWGRYQLTGRLGKGSYGVVFRGIDPDLNRDVAIKLFDAADPDRVKREGALLASIDHPHVVKVWDVAEHDGRYGLCMEFIDGRTYEAILRADGPMHPHQVAVEGHALCRALAALHNKEVLHRDVSARNVMRARGGRVVLMDLGAGLVLVPGQSGGARNIGTPLFMAPELFGGDATSASPRTDIYSLGVLLYNMASGRYPVEGKSTEEIEGNHLNGKRVPIDERLPESETTFVELIERATATDPGVRYESAAAMLRDINRILAPISQEQPPIDLNPRPQDRMVNPTATTATASGRERPVAWSGAPRYWLAIAATCLIIGATIVLGFRAFRGGLATSREPPRVAVLPFVNLSGDASQDFFADGMTDGLINALGRIGGLRVTARTSVMAFKAHTKSVPDVARELHVQTVVEGSVLLATSETARVAVNVVEPSTQTPLNTHTLDVRISDVLTSYGELARFVADTLSVELTSDEQERLTSSRSVDPETQRLYLLGRYEWGGRTPAQLQRALSYFRRAVERSPDYAPAHAGLADVYVLLTGEFAVMPRAEGAAQAMASASRALALDPGLAEAYTSLAFTNFFLLWNWAAADEQFKKALQLNPSYATAHHWYGNYLSDIGREDEALVEIRRALELDPLSQIISRDVAWPLFFSRRYREAMEQLEITLEAFPGYLPAERLRARTLTQLGQHAEALRQFEAQKARGDTARARCEMAWAYALAGRLSDAERELQSALAMKVGIYQYDVALALTAMGRRDEAFAALNLAFDERDPTMVNLRHDPRFDALREDPRYKQLLTKMRFP